MLTVILAVGSDAALLRARTSVLQSAGYLVQSTTSIKEAVECFRNGDFDLVILCHSIPTKDRERLTCLLRASGSGIPVVSVSGKISECDAFANVTLEDGPNKFLIGISDVLLKTAGLPVWIDTSHEMQQITASTEKQPSSGRERKEQEITASSSALAHAS